MRSAAESAPTDAPIATVLIPHYRVTASTLVPEQTMHCTGCGITIHPAALQHDRALLLASCCPRCDGRLVPQTPAGTRSVPSGDRDRTTADQPVAH